MSAFAVKLTSAFHASTTDSSMPRSRSIPASVSTVSVVLAHREASGSGSEAPRTSGLDDMISRKSGWISSGEPSTLPSGRNLRPSARA